MKLLVHPASQRSGSPALLPQQQSVAQEPLPAIEWRGQHPLLTLAAHPSGPILALHGSSIGEQARRLIGANWVEELILKGTPSTADLEEIVEVARTAGRALRVRVSLAVDQLPAARAGESWRPLPDGWLLAPPASKRRGGIWKRAIDLVGATGLLVLLTPLLLAIAMAVRASSPGPVFYRWRVLGRYGRPVTSYKFRTMCAGADEMKTELLGCNEMSGPCFKIASDPRVTPLGRVLRRYSLDELPQLWSVLRGDLSLVGPRPPSRTEYQQFELWQMRKLAVKPGLTCIWQVSGRNRISKFADWAQLDLEYIDRWSHRLDLRILARTMVVVLQGTGC
jgi:lipopolysaccharide/colanic/teichoic acid biosynthesis glycosyltransferase